MQFSSPELYGKAYTGCSLVEVVIPPSHLTRLAFVCLFLHDRQPLLDLECGRRLAGTAGIGWRIVVTMVLLQSGEKTRKI